jgi:hypothetical protein
MTKAQYNQLPEVSEILGNGNTIHYREFNGTFYHAGITLGPKWPTNPGQRENDATPYEVAMTLDMLHRTRQRCRLFLGDTGTGRSWMEEHGVTGTIGRSMGPIKVPLLISSSRSHGGPAILDNCIIRIDVQIKPGLVRTLYQHPQFHVPEMELKEFSKAVFPCEVWIGGSCCARFKTKEKAKRWMQFMRGERMARERYYAL